MAVRDLPRRPAPLALLAGVLCVLLSCRPAWGAEPAGRPLPPPQWVAVTDLRGKALLTWIRNRDYLVVRIYRRLRAEGAQYEQVGEARENTFVDATVPGGGEYAYRLIGTAPDGRESLPSAEATVRIAAHALRPPTPPLWEDYLSLPSGVGLKWMPKEDEDVLTFNIYRRTPPETEFRLIGSARGTSYLDQSAVAGATYVYALSVLDSAFRETPLSRELTVSYLPAPRPVERKKAPEWRARRTRLVTTLTKGDLPFFRPADVALGPRSGNIYVADAGNNCIQVFDRSGRFLRRLGDPARGAFRFARLLGVAVDADERVYGVDAGESVVLGGLPDKAQDRRYDLGRFFPGTTLGLIDAVVGPGGRLLAVDNLNHRLLLAGSEGLERTIGGPGEEPGQFSAPAFCTRDGQGNLYVAEALNARVQVFDARGEFVRAFGTSGRGPGAFGRPKGVAVSAAGEIFVSDSWLNRIQVFSAEGEFLAILTDEAEAPLDLGSPNGIAVDSRSRIHIVERLADRVQIREVLGGP